MAVQLAPYNNAMRLGQGFNSYTQQICLNDAVMQPSKIAKPQSPTPASIENALSKGELSSTVQIPRETTDGSGRTVSQIVSYSSRFVDKLSDITDAMNISASLSIKTATIGGTASGSFVDSDKFKQSDMNFFIQVKVVNQVISGEDYTEFQNVLENNTRFTEVYGDTFISGFEEGGELNALISVKVLDKSKAFAVRAQLEGTMGTPALTGEVTGKVDLEKAEATSSTETTVTVNWSGGGQIKPSDAIWDVNSLTLAATNFPDLVAKTPQKTYAILTKYTTLKSFVKIYPPSSVLTYENAGVYTSALLDIYMDYKSIWKQIQIASFEITNKRAVMRIAKPSKEVEQLAEEYKLKHRERQNEQVTALETSNSPPAKRFKPTSQDLITFNPYSPTPMGLDRARRDCRNEMIKIVTEVDEVTTNPNLALDLTREEKFVSPRVFTQLLPVVTLRPVESGNPEAMNPKDLIILGESDEALPLQQWIFNRPGTEGDTPYPAMLASLDRHKTKSDAFYMGDTWSGVSDPRKADIFFNCLDRIDASWIPKSVAVWVTDNIMTGLKVFYTNASELSHGYCPGDATNTIEIKTSSTQSIIQIIAESVCPGTWRRRVTGLDLILDTCDSSKTTTFNHSVATHTGSVQTSLVRPTNGFWSFRGFWGSVAADKSGFLVLGAVWGLDSSDSILGPGSSPFDYQMFSGEALPGEAIATANRHRSKAGTFSMSQLMTSDPVNKEGQSYFNDLDDPKLSCKVERFFPSGQAVELQSTSSLAVYANANAQVPLYTKAEVWWQHDSKEELFYVHSILLTDMNGQTCGMGPASEAKPAGAVFQAPNNWWSVAGFWGYKNKSDGRIGQIGIVWAKQASPIISKFDELLKLMEG